MSKPLDEKKKSTKTVSKKKRKKRMSKKTVVILSLVLLLSITLVSGYLMLTLDFFNITAITIEGNTKYTEEEILQHSYLGVGKNIFWQSFNNSKNRIISLPYIKNVHYRWKLPSQLIVQIEERVPVYFAFDKEKDRFFRLDEQGYILEEVDISSKTKSELLVSGITFDDEVILGSMINEIDQGKILTFLQVKSEYEASGMHGEITKVNFENSVLTLTLNDRLNVIFPNADNVTYKMSLLKGILEHEGEDLVGIIDMTKTNPVLSSF